ncbi:MAG: hypothetical protein DHS20C18_46150 [Saprospiraceae bacterium]|nr:MAG: hypothetical protein DHS20C18_46150 [Saprospiraceae bacterium]
MESNYFNQEGHLNTEGISWYVERLLEEESGHSVSENGPVNASNTPVKHRIFEHIHQCTDCHQQAIELYRILADVQTGIPVSEDIGSESKPLPWRFGLILLLIPLAYFMWRQQISKPVDEQPSQEAPPPPKNTDGTNQKPVATFEPPREEAAELPEKTPPQNKKANPELLALNFVPLDHLETFAGEMVRGGEWSVLQPKNEAHYKNGEPIIFKWNAQENVPLNLVLLNNREDTLLQQSLQQPEFHLDRQLDPGLYYWKLETATELIYLGKFWVDIE